MDVPQFIEKAFSSSYKSDNTANEVNVLVQCTFGLLIRLLAEAPAGEPLPQPVLRAIWTIFDRENVYLYTHYGHGQAWEVVLEEQEGFIYMPRNLRITQQVSALYLANLNQWADQEGGEALCDRLAKAPLQELPTYLTLIHRLIDPARLGYQIRIKESLKNVGFARFSKVSV